MAFRRNPFLKIFIFCFGLFTEGSRLYSLQGQKTFIANIKSGYETPRLLYFGQRELLLEVKAAAT